MRRRGFLATAAMLPALGAATTRAQCRDDAPAHETQGRIVTLSPDRATLRIAHEEIAGYMRAMTMAFTACPGVDTTALAVGDHVSFRFTRGEGGRLLILWLRREA